MASDPQTPGHLSCFAPSAFRTELFRKGRIGKIREREGRQVEEKIKVFFVLYFRGEKRDREIWNLVILLRIEDPWATQMCTTVQKQSLF